MIGGLVVVAAILAGGCHWTPDQTHFIDVGQNPAPARPVVQVRCAPIPKVPKIACHCWFATFDPAEGRWRRWEVWQEACDRGRRSWGHVRRDLQHPTNGVGHGEYEGNSWVLAECTGSDARAILDVLNRPEAYPDRTRYRYFPGPNSNTYVAWVLRESEQWAITRSCLPPAAWGKGGVIFQPRLRPEPGESDDSPDNP
jgi:hypothetical protein